MKVSELAGKAEAGKWYDVPGSKARAHIRTILPKRLKEIRKECTEKRLIRGTYVEKTDEDRITELMLDEAVIGWEGIEDDDGSAYPVTIESKRRLDDMWSEFHHLWLGVVVHSTSVDAAILDAESGN